MRTKRIQMEDMLPHLLEKLEADGQVIFTITGNSMAPMLHNRQDQICLVKAKNGILEKYDLPLFRRQPEGKFILHRVVRVNPDGTYNILGDNQWQIERGIHPSQIIGVVEGFWRGGHYIDCQNPWYRLYCRAWWLFYPLRYAVLRGRGFLGRLMRHTNKDSKTGGGAC